MKDNFTGFPTSASSQQQNRAEQFPVKFSPRLNVFVPPKSKFSKSSFSRWTAVTSHCLELLFNVILTCLSCYLLTVRPSPSASNKTVSNRKQTSNNFIYPRRAMQFCKKKKKRKRKDSQISLCLEETIGTDSHNRLSN